MGTIFSIACCCCDCILCSCCAMFSPTRAANIGHSIMIILTFSILALLSEYSKSFLNTIPNVHLKSTCDHSYDSECQSREIYYRGTLSLGLVFSLMIFLGMSKKMNESFWPLKYILIFGLFFIFLFISNDFWNGMSYVYRIISLFWLIFQSFLFLDFSFDLHDYFVTKIDDGDAAGESTIIYKISYILLALSAQVSAFIGLSYLYMDSSSCDITNFFITTTLILGIILTFLSALNRTKLGVLAPSLIFAFATYICWYAILSSTDCNEDSNENGTWRKRLGRGISLLLTLITITWLNMHSEKILWLFLPANKVSLLNVRAQKTYGSTETTNDINDPKLNKMLTGEKVNKDDNEKVDDEENVITEQPKENNSNNNNNNNEDDDETEESAITRAIWHFIMLFAICGICMSITDWGYHDGSPENGNETVAHLSMWFKMISQYFLWLFSFRVLYLAWNEEHDDDYQRF